MNPRPVRQNFPESSSVRTPLAAALALASLLLAPQVRSADAPPPPPPPSASPGGAEQEQPEVTIVHRGEDTIEEYRLQGKLYMIKVTPHKGAPYYLIDTDGDGNLETRRSEMTETPLIPSWILFKWK